MTLLEQIESRLAVCAKATPEVDLLAKQGFEDWCGLHIRSLHTCQKKDFYAGFQSCLNASRNQREGELAALKCAVEALEKPYICSVCGDRSKEKCGRVCDGDESSCCKYFLNFDQAVAQITKLMGEGE